MKRLLTKIHHAWLDLWPRLAEWHPGDLGDATMVRWRDHRWETRPMTEREFNLEYDWWAVG